MNAIEFLHNKLSAYNIEGISIGDVNNKETWRCDFKSSATTEDKANAATVIQDFDFESVNSIFLQIAELEAKSHTPRRLREAALGIDGGYMKNIESQIAELRKKK